MYGTPARACGVPNPLQTYFRDINEDSLLAAPEEKLLADAIARGDRDARNRMIQANLRLVVKIARDYLGRGMALEDLIGEGNLGLIRAVEDYDPSFGTRFSTYASYWIKQAIRHALINTTSTIRLPAHMFGLLNKWRRTERVLYREKGKAPSFDEVATHLGLSEVQKGLVVKARRASQLKLESSLADDCGAWSPDESMDAAPGPEAALEVGDERAEVVRRLERLDHRERQVLTFRFGLMGEAPLTLKEIGLRLGITREWVRKIELRAVSKLKSAECQSPAVPARRPGRPAGRCRSATSKSAATRAAVTGAPLPASRVGLRARAVPLRMPAQAPTPAALPAAAAC
jgi:RNA polymerase primary sigma factor